MIFPLSWRLKRPGSLIPVFFLSLSPLSGQIGGIACSATALGGTFVTRQGFCLAMQNQAGLGAFKDYSLSLHHSRPFLIGDLGISSLSFQYGMSHGALGVTFIHAGISGYSQSSVWIAYGINIAENVTAGVGIHGWTHSISERWFHHPGFSFAAGIQWKIRQKIHWGIHLSHPLGWQSGLPGKHALPMKIAMGFGLLLGNGTILHLETHSTTGRALQWRAGLEWEVRHGLYLQFGLHPGPIAVSGGLTFQHHGWKVQTAFVYGLETGGSPATALTYVW